MLLEKNVHKDPALRWLHLTDLHVGKNNELQATALTNLIEAIKKESGDLVFDLVILSGDLAYSGQELEYEKLEQLIINPLKNTEAFRHSKFIATPGNHDMDCEIGLPVIWEQIGSGRRDSFFQLGDVGKKTRSSRAEAFKNYSSFLARNGILGVDPTVEPARAERITVRGLEVMLISAVTSFFSDKDVSDEEISPAPVHPIRTLLQDVDENLPTFVLGHHPPTWFTPETEKHLRTLLIEKNVLYINGHEHTVTSKFGNRGLMSLGFGAVYQATLDATSKSNYRNSFSICELRESLHTKIISWDSDNGAWRIDPNLPPEFSEKSEFLEGGYSLALPSTRLVSISRPYSSLASTVKADLELDRCVWLASNSSKRWVKLLSDIGRFRDASNTFSLPSQTVTAGHDEFRVKDLRGNYLVYVVSGSGDVFTYSQLQSINTNLDTQDYTGCIVATLGTLSDEAETLANKLKGKKPITILKRDTLIRDLIRISSPELRSVIAMQDAALVKLSMIVTDDGWT